MMREEVVFVMLTTAAASFLVVLTWGQFVASLMHCAACHGQ